jgi:hypothetical protein
MIVELDRTGLTALVRGSVPYYNAFGNPLVVKAGHEYIDQYARTYWSELHNLTDKELYELYIICRDSWCNIAS